MREPTPQEAAAFIKLLEKVPLEYLGPHPKDSPDYGDMYTCVYVVHEWLSSKVRKAA